jgi:hypothetical protein
MSIESTKSTIAASPLPWGHPIQLPNDFARCDGYGHDGNWREGCERCLRRIAPRPNPCVMMKPPDIIVFRCEYLIEAGAQQENKK